MSRDQWVIEVLDDLAAYAAKNGHYDLQGALLHARQIAFVGMRSDGEAESKSGRCHDSGG